MLLVEDQVFKVNLRTRVSNPSAHDDLGQKSYIYRSLWEFRVMSIAKCH
jgi:hypothetical protein